MIRPPPISTLFPYTPLSRSRKTQQRRPLAPLGRGRLPAPGCSPLPPVPPHPRPGLGDHHRLLVAQQIIQVGEPLRGRGCDSFHVPHREAGHGARRLAAAPHPGRATARALAGPAVRPRKRSTTPPNPERTTPNSPA